MSFGFSLSLPVRNEWRNVALVQSSVESCFMASSSTPERRHTLGMVTGELVENAIKYGDWSSQDRRFRIDVSSDDRTVTVSVGSPVNQERPNVGQLLGVLEWIGTFNAPGDAYRARLLQVAQESPGAELSRLGLVRIAYEANAKLRADVSDGMLRVTAEMVF
jgi:hypothetical protein